MYKKIVNMLKLIISVYFVFIGVELTKIMMEQRPSDLTLKLVIAAVFILAGAGYFLWTLNRMSGNVWGKIKESWKKQRQEMAQRARTVSKSMPDKVKPQRDSAMFRTAPMTAESDIIKGTARLKEEEPEEVPEELANKEHKMPDSWDEATRAMWMEEESEDDSLKRYWNNEEAEMDETGRFVELAERTQELPVIPEDTQAILDSVGGATQVIPDISDIKDIKKKKKEKNAAEKEEHSVEEEPDSVGDEAIDYEEV